LAASCATLPTRERHLVQRCEFIVYDHTPYALEIRMRVRAFPTTPIGALNPGELLTHSVPCAAQAVWIGGIPMPPQLGAPVGFGVLGTAADLVEGERVEIPLYWP
jgi:hypothetical protein